jgi:hypothetical protein
MSKTVPLLLQYAFMDWAGKIYLLYMPGIVSKDNNVCAPFERKHGLILTTYPRHVTRTHSKTEVTTKLRMDILTLNTNLVKIEQKIGTLSEVLITFVFWTAIQSSLYLENSAQGTRCSIFMAEMNTNIVDSKLHVNRTEGMNFCLSVVTAVKRKRHNITLYLH